MEAHAIDLLRFAIWALVGMGGLLFGLLSFGGKTILSRLDRLESGLSALNGSLGNEANALRDLLHSHDLRITRIEAHCSLFHADRRMGEYRLDPDDNGRDNGR